MAHGDHWSTFFPSLDGVLDLAVETSSKGAVIAKTALPPMEERKECDELLAIVEPGGPVRVCVLLATGPRKKRIISAFPFLQEGSRHIVTIRGCAEWKGPAEGTVAATLGPAAIVYFAPLFAFERSEYEPGASLEVLIAGIAYHVRELEPESDIEITDPERVQVMRRNSGEEDWETNAQPLKIGFHGARIYMPVADYLDDASFITVIESIDEFTAHDVEFWKFEVGLFVDCGESEDVIYRIPLYAAKHVCAPGFTPSVGQTIRGAMWIQGRLAPPQSL